MARRTMKDGDILRLIDVVTKELVALPDFAAGDYDGLRAYYRAADAVLNRLEATEGAKVSRWGDNWTLSMGGIRASSTGGAASVLRNWRAGAQRRFKGEAA